MKIHGLRIYPQSVKVVRGKDAPIYIHGSVTNDCSDLFYIFRSLAHLWRGHVFAKDFGVSDNVNGTLDDPLPGLRSQFGASLLRVDLKSQLLLLYGDDFPTWGASIGSSEAALMPIFRGPPTPALLKRLYWSRSFRLTEETWPRQMRALLHMWDDIYWQLFTTKKSDVDLLIQTHAGDPKLKLYFVDLEREYPDPSNEELQPATIAEGTRDA